MGFPKAIRRKMREYELTYLVSDEVLESDLNKVTRKVSGFISNVGGKIKKEEIWGRRKLAYPIRKQNFANYITLWVGLPADQIASTNHELQVMSRVLRHLLIIKARDEEQRKITKEDIIEDEELEKVIGDKSVEIIAGETEESYNLMAKRESSEEEEEEERPETEKIKEDKEEKPKKKQKTKDKEIKAKEVKEGAEAIADKKVGKETKKVKESKVKKEVKKPAEKEDDEADRIKKLDEKLDELLKDDL
jgi:small subunit ribosomal protein S6